MYTIMVVFVKIRLQLNCLNKKVEKMNVNPIEYSNLFHSFQQAWLVFLWVVLVYQKICRWTMVLVYLYTEMTAKCSQDKLICEFESCS